MYETVRIVGKLRPKYVIWENVKNVLSVKHKHNFDNYINAMSSLGYKNYYQVLNAKDYGIPQNRERVFTISIRNDIDKTFEFPNGFPLELRLKDMLESEVEERYYLSEKMKNYILDFNNAQKDTKWENRAENASINTNVAYTLGVRSAGGCQRAGVSNFVIDNCDEEIKVKDLKCVQTEPEIMLGGAYGRNFGSKGKIQNTDVCDTLQAAMGAGGGNVPLTSLYANRIRKLTPKECWRLMGFTDDEFEKASSVGISNTQLYKQARKFNRS